MLAEEIRWGAVSPGSEWSISTIRADFVSFTSKFVRISPNLLAGFSIVLESVRLRQVKPVRPERSGGRMPLAGKGVAALVPASTLKRPERAAL